MYSSFKLRLYFQFIIKKIYGKFAANAIPQNHHILFCVILFSKNTDAQYLRAVVGTDIPMQYLVGLNYQQGKYVSAEMSLGYVGYPYNGDLYKVISVPEKHQPRKDFLMETTDDGWVWEMGINGHFKKWYGGIFVQRLELHASASYRYILGSELFQQEISPEDRVLVDLFLDQDIDLVGVAGVDLDDIMRINTVAWQGGIKFGRRFFFKNRRWEFRADIGISKNLSSDTESEYDKDLFSSIQSQYAALQLYAAYNPEGFADIEDQLDIKIPLDVQLESILDFETKEDEIDDWFHEYAYIPTLNMRFTYLLFIPNKLKQEQQKVEEQKQQEN